ncbi:impB/mucB/samB family protein [Modicisalibacter xianhensis]|uniref:ImpB/mucB/samB family protein n=1 Tax=Modicisalibacter xianhensis TaxID=442341 RepID=A0A4R8FFL0_9GAMM|nr:impB/mucB/samB family protein [Halomonas xianhensis]
MGRGQAHDIAKPKQNIMTSRSFGRLTGYQSDLREAIRVHASRGAEKLRRQGSVARAIMVFLQTNRHRADLAQYNPSLVVQLPRPTDDSRIIINSAQRAGVMMIDLADKSTLQLDLLNTPQSDADRERNERLMNVMDKINREFGRDAVSVGKAKKDSAWKLRCQHQTPRYTTRWDELPVAWIR